MQYTALLNSDEVTKILRVSKTTLYRWTQNNLIPFIRINGHFRFRQSDIDGFLEDYSHKKVVNQ